MGAEAGAGGEKLERPREEGLSCRSTEERSCIRGSGGWAGLNILALSTSWLYWLELNSRPGEKRAGGLTLEWREGGGTERSSSATQILLRGAGLGDQDRLTGGGGGLGSRGKSS